MKPGETPRYSVSHQASNYVQRSSISQNIEKRFGAVAVIFSIYLKPVLYGFLKYVFFFLSMLETVSFMFLKWQWILKDRHILVTDVFLNRKIKVVPEKDFFGT